RREWDGGPLMLSSISCSSGGGRQRAGSVSDGVGRVLVPGAVLAVATSRKRKRRSGPSLTLPARCHSFSLSRSGDEIQRQPQDEAACGGGENVLSEGTEHQGHRRPGQGVAAKRLSFRVEQQQAVVQAGDKEQSAIEGRGSQPAGHRQGQ